MVPCIDENENCRWWADIGECHNNPNYMLPNCRYSCKQCNDEDAGQLECKDFFTDDCPKWAAMDLCKRDSWVENIAGFLASSSVPKGNHPFVVME